MAKRWDPAKYMARQALSTVVNRPVTLERAEKGSKIFNQGLLVVKDAETGEIVATVNPQSLRDPRAVWDLRPDC